RRAIGLAVLRAVDPAIGPTPGLGLAKAAEHRQAADRPCAQGRIGIAPVDRRAAIADRLFEPDDLAAELGAAARDRDHAAAAFAEPAAGDGRIGGGSG